MHMRARIVSRISQGLALLVMGIALASPGVHAAERKKAVAKKAASTTVAKRTPAKSSAKAPRRTVAVKAARASAVSARAPVRVAAEPARLSFGQLAGLHDVSDPLDLKSSVAW